ncbi:amino acid ABC transporter permease [Bartonella tamiae]|nr:ABC transporter permease subunit [Bartonella tamiae]
MSILLQILVLIVLFFAIHWITHNTITNLKASGIASGFEFLDKRAGFNQPSSIIQYDDNATNGKVIFASIVNLMFIAVLCLITATILGLIIGVARLSKNWLIAKLALCYVEFFRNIPPLVLLFFWSIGVMQILPSARQSLIWGGIIINIRGFYFPQPIWERSMSVAIGLTVFALMIALCLFLWMKYKQRDGERTKINGWICIFIAIALPVISFSIFGRPKAWDIPVLQGFNYKGGFYVSPEFVALYLALSIYTAALIAETIRAGLQGVDRGVKEAGMSLGLSNRLIMRLITLPLAMRIIIPPLSSQYMNLIKNTSLGAAVGYSELMMVSSTIIEKTGQSIELAVIWIVVYLGLSLFVSILMNVFNKYMAVLER